MTVADVGAGFGAWTMRLARELGPTGRVYATDVGAAQIAALRDVTQRERLNNVTVIEGAVSSSNLPALCCDAILIRDAYHHFTEPEALIRSFAASLKPGGRLVVIDFPPRPNTEVPSGVPANRGGHGVPPEVVQREVGAVLTHVRTVSAWSPDEPTGVAVPPAVQKTIGRSARVVMPALLRDVTQRPRKNPRRRAHSRHGPLCPAHIRPARLLLEDE